VLDNDIRKMDEGLEKTRLQAAELETVDEAVIADVKQLLADEIPDADFASVEGCLVAENDAARKLSEGTEAARNSQKSAIGNAVKAMQGFLDTWPEFMQDMDASIEARGEYRSLADRLVDDDLPKHRETFKKYLQDNTIRDIAGFSSRLDQHARKIGDRIATINASLKRVDFNAGTYIELEARPNPHQEIREFQSRLRECTEGATGADAEGYTEQKFRQVSAVIERLRGREGFTGIDKAWRERVTDIRNWRTFLARERDRETGTERESYADSDGKSGGQKEKLAYTVLAASLAYQYKLDDEALAPRQFRFVMIDEAFGRGSEESARFGLDLFTSQGFQLLVVTPLEKIEVIAPYVDSVGFVDNPSGGYSRLRNLTIKEYQERRAGGKHRMDQ
jgi:uncharacterized protein YPO0396